MASKYDVTRHGPFRSQLCRRPVTPGSPGGDPPSKRARIKEAANRIVSYVMAYVMIVTSLLQGLAPAVAYAAPTTRAATRSTSEYQQVDNSVFFNEGNYLNLQDNMQDPPFVEADFEVEGGHMVQTSKSVNANTDGWLENGNTIYNQCQIRPNLIGRDAENGLEGWAFVADDTYEDAEGARVTMTYREIGYLKDIGDPSVNTSVDIKVTYTIKQAVHQSDWTNYPNDMNILQQLTFDGHPVIHFTDYFSYGTNQYGITNMAATFEFLDHNTGKHLDIESIYFTKTSMDKGESAGIDPGRIYKTPEDPGVYLANSAYPTKTHYNIADQNRFDVIQGTYIYNGAHDDSMESLVSFAGAPHIHAPGDNINDIAPSRPPEYVDTIGDPTYYWRSVCFRVDMVDQSSLTVDQGAFGRSKWTEDFDIADPTNWVNYGSMYTTYNFTPLTNPLPQKPVKTINDQAGPITGVGIGDTVNYKVAQQVVDMGHDGNVKYLSFQYVDPLPQYVQYIDSSAQVIDPYGNPISDSNFSVDYDTGSNTVTVTLSEDFLLNGMVYEGGDYTLSIDVEVVDQPADDLELVQNDADVVINGYSQTTNIVEYEPIHPVLDIEKHAVLDYNLASAINEYEYLNHDENENFSTVHYEGYMQNITDKTRAKNVTIYDNLAPGLTLVPGSVKVTGADGIEVTENPDGKGWTATLPDLYPWTQISFEYDCYTTTEGNGLEVVNTAKTWCTNATLGTEGAEDKHAYDDGEIYINDPNLKIVKNVTESPIQNDDYQRGEEYRVDDTFTYSVTLTNTIPGTFAKNVRLTDDDMPEGFELVSGPQVTGLDNNGEGYKIPYPISGESDSIHGEEETRTIEYQLTDVKNENGSWGWNLDINYLDYNRPVTVTWTVKATQAMNGYEVYNRAHATADNQPNDTFWSTDGRTGSDYTIVWINTPEFQIDKSVRKTDSAYQIGDVAAYDIELTGLKTPGTLARETTLEDQFLQDGTTIVEGSFVITDKPTEDEPQDISGQVELNRFVGKQGWHVDMTQVYGDDTGYWVNSEDWRPIYKDGAEGVVDGEHNPVQSKPEYDKEDCVSDEVNYGHDYFKVHYEATINDMALQNEIIHNEATVNSKEDFPATDDAEVTAIGAQLMIEKTANIGTEFAVGDMAEYELTITNNATGTVAENVMIDDRFTTEKAGTISIVKGSIEVFDNQGKKLALSEDAITYVENEAGEAFGFEIATGYDLPSSQKLTVRYDVKYLSNNGGHSIVNVAHTWADNAPKVQDDYEVWPEDMDQTFIHVDKGSDKQAYEGGEVGTYKLHVSNQTEDQTAINVTVHDEITLDSLGIAQIVKGSIKIWDQNHDAVGLQDIVYEYGNGGQIKGFTIYTGMDLEPGEFFDVEYQVRFDEVAQQTQVHNEVWVSADNTGKATDENDVTVYPDGGTPEDPDNPDNPPVVNPGDPKLAITKDSNKQWFTPGEQGQYSLRVINTEEGTTAENVRITDALDADARAYASIVEGSVEVVDATGSAIPVESISYQKDDSGRVYGIDIATGYDLASGGAINVTYDVLFDGDIEGRVDVHNAASASADNTPGAQTDHNVNLDIEGVPELVLDKSVDKESAAPGDKLTYTVTVTQPAEGMTATDVVVTDTLPEGFELDQKSVKVEKDGHEQTVNAEFPDGKIRVELGDVAYGEKWTVTYSGKVAEDFLGDKLTNVVIAESPDIPENPEDTTTTTLGDPALEIVKSADKEKVSPGDDLTWEIVVTQVTKDEVATGVVVTDELPDGFSAEQADVTVVDAQGNPYKANVALTDGKLTVELGDLAYNDPVTITVPGTVDDTFDDPSMENTAIAEAENVPDPVKDDAEVLNPMSPDAEATITKDVSDSKVNPGDRVTYTLVATAGATDLENAVVTDEPADGVLIQKNTIELTIDGKKVELSGKAAANDEKAEEEPLTNEELAEAARKLSESGDLSALSGNGEQAPAADGEDTNNEDLVAKASDQATDKDSKQTSETEENKPSETQNAFAPYYEMGSTGVLTVHIGDLKAHSVAEVTYEAVVDQSKEHVGEDLENTATLDADNLDNPLEDTAVVKVDGPTTPADVVDEVGKNLGKTGDWLAANTPVVLCAICLFVLFCLTMYNRDDILVAAEGLPGPLGALATGILNRMDGIEDGDAEDPDDDPDDPEPGPGASAEDMTVDDQEASAPPMESDDSDGAEADTADSDEPEGTKEDADDSDAEDAGSDEAEVDEGDSEPEGPSDRPDDGLTSGEQTPDDGEPASEDAGESDCQPVEDTDDSASDGDEDGHCADDESGQEDDEVKDE